ncbi:hypothetical protein SO802_017534 [Lithocarpus litseifolius]|uniref:Protein kinase domain-containing protein n=1 Tax=Lithocarpus litseifolius TaxID=425828 RepID=A0AAW2CJR5_9ROSI
MAPEYISHGHYSVKSDVFSFGILVLEIVSGEKSWLCNIDDVELLLSYMLVDDIGDVTITNDGATILKIL